MLSKSFRIFYIFSYFSYFEFKPLSLYRGLSELISIYFGWVEPTHQKSKLLRFQTIFQYFQVFQEPQPMSQSWPHGHWHGRLGEDKATFVRTTESSAVSPFEALKILEEGNKRHFEKYGVWVGVRSVLGVWLGVRHANNRSTSPSGMPFALSPSLLIRTWYLTVLVGSSGSQFLLGSPKAGPNGNGC